MQFMRNFIGIFCGTFAMAMSACGAGAVTVVNEIAGADPMVPFDSYLLPPSYEAPQLSPDGRHIACQ
jgi:hypothetical protein